MPLTLNFLVVKSFSKFPFKACLLSAGCLRFETRVILILKYSMGVILFSPRLHLSRIEVSVIFSASIRDGLVGNVSEKQIGTYSYGR